MTGLPIEAALPKLRDALKNSNQAVLRADPGAGKTTRVPLFLLEEGLFDGRIVMLEPRRLAARAAAERMAQTLNEPVGKTVGYRMRGDSKTSNDTRIEVITEGILTRLIQSDPELTGISCIIFDEFHERSLQSDLGLALALEIRAALREDLCLIAMSATLDTEPLAAVMGDAPVVASKGRSFPVETHHLPRPWARPGHRGPRFEEAFSDWLVTAFDQTDGGVLAFLPGVGEIRRVQENLARRLPAGAVLRPLYGAMPFADQRAAIHPEQNKRKIVLATSIAETSLTIQDISVVVDGGRARRSRFDAGSGMSRLVTERVTKAEATQRQGRAGRVAAGQCFKFWTKGEEGGLQPFPEPEIHATDLTGLVLELAAWGTSNPADLPFLDPPKPVPFQSAQELLRSLGALDDGNAITAHGREISRLPVHPRLGHMILNSGKDSDLVAALLENRDILMRSNTRSNSDFSLRLDAARDPKRFESERPFKVDRGALNTVKQDARRIKPSGRTRPLSQMAALAYPDRIGLRRKGDAPRFLLSGGKGAFFEPDDPLGAERMIVATDLDGDSREAKVRSAVAFSEADLRELYAEQITEQKVCHWSKRDRSVVARVQSCFGALVLSEQHWKDCPPDALADGMLQGIRELGLQVLPWSKTASLLRGRIEWLRAEGADVPDCSDEGLLTRAEDWLLPHLSGLRKLDDLNRLDLTTLLRNSLTWEQQSELDRLAPSSVSAPTGTRLSVDYSKEQPQISVRLQELFGMTEHPCVGPKRLPLLIELLSPAQRPVQTTADLPGFWTTSYSDVRKDMRGRYPKHPWPEDPTTAEPTRRVKPRGR